MESLKILHVIGQRPEMTGSGIYIEALIRESEKRGFANYRVAGVPAKSPPDGADDGTTKSSFVLFETEGLNFSVTGMSDVMPYRSSLFKDLKGRRLTAYKAAFTRALDEAVTHFQPDIIHANHLFVLTALVRELFPHIPVVATCHGTELRQYDNCPHLRDYVRRHCRRLNRIIALTADQKQNIQRVLGISPEKIVVVGGGYDGACFSRLPKKKAGTVQLLYAGKINRSKGVPWLLKSLMKITQPEWHLDLAGSGKGPEFDACMRLAAELGSKVTCHGHVTHQRLCELMQNAHVQVLPSFFEGLPLVLFEGLACGCRIITTRLPGFEEIFGRADSKSIDLIALPPLETIDRPFAGDEEKLEKMLTRSLMKMMAQVRISPEMNDPQAEQIAADYTWPKIFERILKVYGQVTSRSC